MSVGQHLTAVEVSVTSSAGGTTVLAENALRTFLAIHNIEDQAMSFTTDGTTPTTSTGFSLPAGSVWTFDHEPPQGAVKAISHSGTKKVRIAEGV